MSLDLAHCKDANPELFDHIELPAAALSYCKRCPVRGWCLDRVNPAASTYTGIVGGYVWSNGGLFKQYNAHDTEFNDPDLVFYLTRKNRRK